MKNKLSLLIIFLFFALLYGAATQKKAQDGMNYFLTEVEQDALLTHEAQHEKINEYKAFADQLSPAESSILTRLLLEECRTQVVAMYQLAGLDESETQTSLQSYDQAVKNFQTMDVESARKMLFFIAELKLHREYVYKFGIALGCPEKQLLRHDLCKLNSDQFEGYTRYFRGGKKEEDKLAYLAAWHEHQNEEHHHECYSMEGFDFDNFPKDRLQNNMAEAVADLLAATKQRGGSLLTDWLLNDFPNKNPNPGLIPYLEDALIKAHTFYLESEKNPESSNIFKDLPCWNSDIAEAFSKLRNA